MRFTDLIITMPIILVTAVVGFDVPRPRRRSVVALALGLLILDVVWRGWSGPSS